MTERDFLVGQEDGPYIYGKLYPDGKLRLSVKGFFGTFIDLSPDQVAALKTCLDDTLEKLKEMKLWS